VSYRILLTDAAIGDFIRVRQWIASEADDEVAVRYTDRLSDRLASLIDFPNRGTPRPDYAPGCRSTTFERRYIIIYRVLDDIVSIERIVDGYGDWDWLR
jgi:toxin ParE1/3/4